MPKHYFQNFRSLPNWKKEENSENGGALSRGTRFLAWSSGKPEVRREGEEPLWAGNWPLFCDRVNTHRSSTWNRLHSLSSAFFKTPHVLTASWLYTFIAHCSMCSRVRVAVSSFHTLSDRWESMWNEGMSTRISNSNVQVCHLYRLHSSPLCSRCFDRWMWRNSHEVRVFSAFFWDEKTSKGRKRQCEGFVLMLIQLFVTCSSSQIYRISSNCSLHGLFARLWTKSRALRHKCKFLQ